MTLLSDPRTQPRGGGPVDYGHVVPRFLQLLRRALPQGATVAVVSKGDQTLVRIDGRYGWHYPQRADGVYAGYYPPDDASAIAHLETLRERGADFLALPASAFWWLEHYPGLAYHLESRYRLLARDEDAGAVYMLFEPGARRNVRENGSTPGRGRSTTSSEDPAACVVPFDESEDRNELALEEVVNAELLDDLRTVFDVEYYTAQAGVEFDSDSDALHHYLADGYRRGFDPHPLFDGAWYASRCAEVKLALANPLLHFLTHSVAEQLDPSPYFDTEYYYAQGPSLRDGGINALVHYVRHSPADAAYRPNPLFGGGYYLGANPDVRRSGVVPLAHYVQFGCAEGRNVSQVHQSMAQHMQRSSTRSLVRGNWRRGLVLFFVRGEDGNEGLDVAPVVEGLARDYRIGSLIVSFGRSALTEAVSAEAGVLVLDDFRVACDIFRPSALRMLAKTLSSLRPLFAVSEVPEAIEGLRIAEIGTYLAPGRLQSASRLAEGFEHAHRILLPSSAAFRAAAGALGRYPTNVAVYRTRDEPSEISARALMDLAQRDFKVELPVAAQKRASSRQATRRVLIPCSDWNVSGVNVSLEAVGRELIRLGWDVEILFTRDESFVLRSAGDGTHMPEIPYRFVRPRRPGIFAMWEALVAEIEAESPCIAFMGYDFLGNSVAPALTDSVGVVSWLQADDGDYYEQAYRLGRYCNAVVCVSEFIRRNVHELHPLIGKRAHVIHNSSVRAEDVVATRSWQTEALKIVYAGRLVQYQKRVLDYVRLAEALDRAGVPYKISLIGTFSAHDGAQGRFERDAGEHLDDGRIALLGRMSRTRILAALDEQDLFVLLSDFEGFPLALVESMARGCVPVVSSSNSGIPELVRDGDNGLVVSGRDYDEWARVLGELWRDRRRLSVLSRRGRETVRTSFTLEHASARFDELLRSVADELAAGTYVRPPALNWGAERSMTGDVLPPPSLFRPAAIHIDGLR